MASEHRSHPSAARPQLFGITGDPASPHAESVLRRAVRLGGDRAELVLGLAANVGGVDALEALHPEPLPAVPFHWGSVRPADIDQVMRILARIDAAELWFLDTEDRIVVDRLLEELLAHDPAAVCHGDPARTAAALVWLALQGNARLGGRRRVFAVDVWQAFGVTSCSQRGRRLHAVLGLDRVRPWSAPRLAGAEVRLSRVSLLHSATRARLIAAREALIRLLECEPAAPDVAPVAAAAAPLPAPASAVRVVTPRRVERITTSTGRVVVLVAVAGHTGDGEVLQLSVPDARSLVNQLSRALDGASPDGRYLRLCT
jgi:hypothetical protein